MHQNQHSQYPPRFTLGDPTEDAAVRETTGKLIPMVLIGAPIVAGLLWIMSKSVGIRR